MRRKAFSTSDKSNDIETRLRYAIDSWCEQRPRRWLQKYGGMKVYGDAPLAIRYRNLCDKAKKLISRPRVESVNGLPSHQLNM